MGIEHRRFAGAAWPERPVVLVPFPAGGVSDVLARVTAGRLQIAFGRSFVVENDPAPPASWPRAWWHARSPTGTRCSGRPYRRSRSRRSLTRSILIRSRISSRSPSWRPRRSSLRWAESFPAGSSPAFAAYVRSQPGALHLRVGGTGGLTHLASEVFLKERQLSMIHVPYKVSAGLPTTCWPARSECWPQAPSSCGPISASTRWLLAVTGANRSRLCRTCPPSRSSSRRPRVVTWNGLLAPARTPQTVIDVAREIGAAERNPDFRSG